MQVSRLSILKNPIQAAVEAGSVCSLTLAARIGRLMFSVVQASTSERFKVKKVVIDSVAKFLTD